METRLCGKYHKRLPRVWFSEHTEGMGNCTEIGLSQCSRQVEAEVVSNQRNQLHLTQIGASNEEESRSLLCGGKRLYTKVITIVNQKIGMGTSKRYIEWFRHPQPIKMVCLDSHNLASLLNHRPFHCCAETGSCSPGWANCPNLWFIIWCMLRLNSADPRRRRWPCSPIR